MSVGTAADKKSFAADARQENWASVLILSSFKFALPLSRWEGTSKLAITEIVSIISGA